MYQIKKYQNKLILTIMIYNIINNILINKVNSTSTEETYTIRIGVDEFQYKMEEDIYTHMTLLYPKIKLICDMEKNALLHTIFPKYKFKLIKFENREDIDECLLPFNMDIYEYAYRNNYNLKIIINNKEYSENSKIIKMNYIRNIKMKYIYSNSDDTEDINIPIFKLNKYYIYNKLNQNLSTLSKYEKYIPYTIKRDRLITENIGNNPDSIFNNFEEFYNLLKILISFKYDICSNTSTIRCIYLILIFLLPLIIEVLILISFCILIVLKRLK
jgi:hypothetical protein